MRWPTSAPLKSSSSSSRPGETPLRTASPDLAAATAAAAAGGPGLPSCTRAARRYPTRAAMAALRECSESARGDVSHTKWLQTHGTRPGKGNRWLNVERSSCIHGIGLVARLRMTTGSSNRWSSLSLAASPRRRSFAA